MRATSRLLATVKSASKYLEAYTPTGLTGLSTHPSPRPALVWTYRQTLQRLGQLPKSSVYRQSTEALTKHRLEIVESVKPEGYDQWLERVRKQIAASPKAYGHLLKADGSLASEKPAHVEIENWDGEITKADAHSEGVNDLSQAEHKARAIEMELKTKEMQDKEGQQPSVEDLEVEPPLNREQIDAIEKNIGAGLIEEVIQVAEGELALVEEMMRHQVWEDLEEKPQPGQWSYFERGDRV
ncbi:hypothetical protein H2200_005881 [Cladophialophora chaetospira]|uniref:NADH-ubiquinone oxidoreductase 29.9 kDa subunit, mitochondrial n=1 Tax=Cladophialophora chaetospira TaxID=386627 RepID=A0AA39CIL0_9EURO|nr:hypothetical protein H2200_005881 [Cladophialophora chaetospira]